MDGVHHRLHKRGHIDGEDLNSDSSTVSSVPTPTSFTPARPLCDLTVHDSHLPLQVSAKTIILPPFKEISRIAGQCHNDRRNNTTSPACQVSFDRNIDGASSAVDRKEWHSTPISTSAGTSQRPRVLSSPFPTSMPLPSYSPSPLSIPLLPPLAMSPWSSPRSPQLATENAPRATTHKDEPTSSPSPIFDWHNHVLSKRGSGDSCSDVVGEPQDRILPQFDPRNVRQRSYDEESTASEEVAFCYDHSQSTWQKHCIRVALEDGRSQFRCTWIRNDTKSGKCEYQGKRQLVQRHIEMTHLNIRRFICLWPGCNQRYGQKSSFDVHRRTHTGERPFKCKQLECQIHFNDPAGLLRHMVQEHQYKPKTRKSNYPDGHPPVTTNRPRNRRNDGP